MAIQPPDSGTPLEKVWPLINIGNTPGPLVGMEMHPLKKAWWLVRVTPVSIIISPTIIVITANTVAFVLYLTHH
jgi:hypothetical protein